MTTGVTEEGLGEVTERMLLGLLVPYTIARADEQNAASRKESLARLIKQYLTTHEGEQLYDGENRIRAKLQTRSSGDVYYVKDMPDNMVLELARLGALSVDTKVIKNLIGKDHAADAAQQFRHPGGTTTALVVEVI